jgi:hypothetical protein
MAQLTPHFLPTLSFFSSLHTRTRTRIRRKLHRQDAMHSLLKSAGDETMSSHTAMLNPSHCFSILFRGDWTLDLIMLGSGGPRPSLVDRDTILDALDLVLTTYQRQKHLVANDVLLLRYHWMDAVSDKVRRRRIGAALEGRRFYYHDAMIQRLTQSPTPATLGSIHTYKQHMHIIHLGHVPPDIFVGTARLTSPNELLFASQGLSGCL